MWKEPHKRRLKKMRKKLNKKNVERATQEKTVRLEILKIIIKQTQSSFFLFFFFRSVGTKRKF